TAHTNVLADLRVKQAQLHQVETKIIDRIEQRAPKLDDKGMRAADSLDKAVAANFAAKHGRTLTFSGDVHGADRQLDKIPELFEVRQKVLDDIINRHVKLPDMTIGDHKPPRPVPEHKPL